MGMLESTLFITFSHKILQKRKEIPMFYQKLLSLCAKKGVSVSKVCKEIGLATSAAVRWKNGSVPNMTTLYRIANYFDIKGEYLIADNYADYETWLSEVRHMSLAEVIHPTWAEEKAPSNESAMDEEFMVLARQLTPSQMQRVKDFMRGVLS